MVFVEIIVLRRILMDNVNQRDWLFRHGRSSEPSVQSRESSATVAPGSLEATEIKSGDSDTFSQTLFLPDSGERSRS